MMSYASAEAKVGTSSVWWPYFLLGSIGKMKYAIDKKNKFLENPVKLVFGKPSIKLVAENMTEKVEETMKKHVGALVELESRRPMQSLLT